jgi:hypothetical protein
MKLIKFCSRRCHALTNIAGHNRKTINKGDDMEKMRLQSLEMFVEDGLCTIEHAIEVAFKEIDKTYADLEKNMGLKLQKPTTIILFDKEYTRPE